MPRESTAGQGTAAHVDDSSTELRNELWAMLDEVGSKGDPLDQWLGPLAGLLISRWAAHDESKREAAAAANNRAFDPGLPEALRLPAWDGPMANQADAVAEALRRMTSLDGVGSGAACYVAQVAPLVVRSVENSPSMFKGLFDWVRRLDLGTPQGRALAAHLFDDVLRAAVDKQGKLLGEFVTPRPVVDFMLELAKPAPGGQDLRSLLRLRRDSDRGGSQAPLDCPDRLAWREGPCPALGGLRRRDQPVLVCNGCLQGAAGRHRPPRPGTGRRTPKTVAPGPLVPGLRLHRRRSTLGSPTRFASRSREPLPVSHQEIRESVPAARNGPLAPARARCRCCAGQRTFRFRSGPPGAKGIAVGLQSRRRGLLARRRFRSPYRHPRESDRFSPREPCFQGPLRRRVAPSVAKGLIGRSLKR